MKDFEYRVWKNDAKEMFYHSPISSKLCGMTITGLFYREGKVQDWIPLQYIGLKDKNGKKIYEGDLVQYDPEEQGIVYEYEGVVEYNSDTCCFEIVTKDSSNYMFEESGTYLVVGNIYEEDKGNIE